MWVAGCLWVTYCCIWCLLVCGLCYGSGLFSCLGVIFGVERFLVCGFTSPDLCLGLGVWVCVLRGLWT